MIEIQPGLLVPKPFRTTLETDKGFAPSELAERFLHSRARHQRQVRSPVIRKSVTLWTLSGRKTFPDLQFGMIQLASRQLWASYVPFRGNIDGYLGEYLQSIDCSDNLPQELYGDASDYREPLIAEIRRSRWRNDPQGIVGSLIGVTHAFETESLALVLLRELSPDQNEIELDKILMRQGVSEVLAAAGLLVQTGAAVVKGNELQVTNEGLRILRMNQRTTRSKPSTAASSWRKKLFISGMLAAVGAAALASKEAIKRATSSSTAIKSKEIDVALDQEGVREDPNYRAYLTDLAELKKKYKKCVVAYSAGELVAVGENVSDLESKIPPQYWKERLLIKDIPETPVRVRPRLRVTP